VRWRRVEAKAFDKQTGFLVVNLNHPSLHAKKYAEATDMWQARVNRDWLFYFTIEGDLRHPQDHSSSEVSY
jgi:hypothetical protein